MNGTRRQATVLDPCVPSVRESVCERRFPAQTRQQPPRDGVAGVPDPHVALHGVPQRLHTGVRCATHVRFVHMPDMACMACHKLGRQFESVGKPVHYNSSFSYKWVACIHCATLLARTLLWKGGQQNLPLRPVLIEHFLPL